MSTEPDRRQPVPAAHQAGPDAGRHGVRRRDERHRDPPTIAAAGGQPARRDRGRQRPHRRQLLRLGRRHHEAVGRVPRPEVGARGHRASTGNPNVRGLVFKEHEGAYLVGVDLRPARHAATTRAIRRPTSSGPSARSTSRSSAAGTSASRRASSRSSPTRRSISTGSAAGTIRRRARSSRWRRLDGGRQVHLRVRGSRQLRHLRGRQGEGLLHLRAWTPTSARSTRLTSSNPS